MAELWSEELKDIQGIILSGYGHLDYASYLFLHICDPKEGRRWLRQVIPYVSSSEPWPELPNGKKDKPETALNIAFTYNGFRALGLGRETLDSFAEEFIQGMAARADVNGDDCESAPEHWELGSPEAPPSEEIHVLVAMLGRDAETIEELLVRQQQLVEETGGGVTVVSLQDGFRPPTGKEPFGFHDGLSQPVIEGVGRHDRGDPSLPVKKGEFILGYLNEYGLYPVSPVVPAAADPDKILPKFPDGELPNCRDFGRNGTYFVFRKLEQHVAEFWQFIEQHSDAVPHEMLKLAAKFVGRWPSGAPITLVPDSDDVGYAFNNSFQFLPHDEKGYSCPIGSHIRRANPRDTLVNDNPAESFKTCSRHRVVRRGIPYGPPAFTPDAIANGHAPVGLKDDGHVRGLHFIAINASITRQFEFLMQSWFNSTFFASQFDDTDPIVGNNNDRSFITIQEEPYRRRLSLPRFVIVRGGAYFFMPSLRALHYLAQQ
jgi:Dyp-type peroxidase family